ncbi:flagellar biosynthetic protein FliR [Amphritea balenae]|uniref:Flagellar biosynthetic protein FliR n=1 Tax=Amphritea balenae TaxID=452629 RepID=A0A3P1SQ16_9GAMM|nr:flagellar biosynthetic protein FliR [Amphritea balenae]RRC99227.1 flagellar type III secretion system protein FliR [Amphritea balenae]GGK72907.1 flagellar biosynthetic protein FliR [Amphritea balenae]
MLALSTLQIEQWVAQFLLPFFRIASFFMVVPMIGTRLVPARIRMGLALAMTVVLLPVLPEMPVLGGMSLQTYILTAEQILIGTAMAFVVQVLFQVFVMGGQIISSQMGLGFASVSDPANGVSVVVLSQFYLTMVMLLFLAFNGHLVLFEVLARSFYVLPVADGGLPVSSYLAMAKSGSWMISSSLLMALPAVTALLVINFAFGVMTKAAPQLNIFAIGFPFTMMMGLLITWVSLEGFLGQYQRFTSIALDYIDQILGIGL